MNSAHSSSIGNVWIVFLNVITVNSFRLPLPAIELFKFTSNDYVHSQDQILVIREHHWNRKNSSLLSYVLPAEMAFGVFNKDIFIGLLDR